MFPDRITSILYVARYCRFWDVANDGIDQIIDEDGWLIREEQFVTCSIHSQISQKYGTENSRGFRNQPLTDVDTKFKRSQLGNHVAIQ